MSELLHGWYVDSSPGCGAVTPQKCGNLIPSMGLLGVSTITQPDTTDVSTLGGRSLNAPGTLPATAPDRAPFYLLMKDVVWFDGHSALYHLPLHADSGNFSMSFWYNPYEDEFSDLAGPGTFGLVYGGPAVEVTTTDPGGNEVKGTRYFRANPTSILGDAGVIDYQRVSGTSFAGARYSMGSNFVTDPIDDMQGWCHVMMSVQRSGGTSKLTLWIDETEIVTAQDIGDVATMPFADGTFFDSDGTRHCWTIGGRTDALGGNGSKTFFPKSQVLSQRYAGGGINFVTKGTGTVNPGPIGSTFYSILDADGYEQIGSFTSTASAGVLQAPPATYDITYTDGGGTHTLKSNIDINLNWYIGDDATLASATASLTQGSWLIFQKKGESQWKGSIPSDGKGLIGAITELWIAPGQFIDWSVSGNRQKFHTSDLVGQHFAPVDLGDDGSTPTGTKPLIYCTGAPQQFKVNRATGKKLTVFRNTEGGFVGELLDYLKPPQ